MNVLTQDKIDTIARCFAETNFQNKGLALRNAGYSDNYSKHDGLKLFDKSRVKKAIQLIQAKNRAKTEVTQELQRQRVTELFEKAYANGDIKTALTAADQLNRHVGFYDADNATRSKPFVLVFNHKDKVKQIVSNQ